MCVNPMLLTKNETADAEEPVHGIQPPSDQDLQLGSHLSNNEVEQPVRGSGQGYTLGADGQGHDLKRLLSTHTNSDHVTHTSGG